MLSEEEKQRYNRQIILDEIGLQGQEKLKQTSILIVGIGGLGSISSLYCVAGGFGTVGLVDNDTVSLSNLQRQVLYRSDQLGEQKTLKAKESLHRLNPNVQINTYNCFLTNENAQQIIKDYDIVIDGADNFKVRYAISDACLALNKPFVYGSIMGWCGQVAVLCHGKNCATYRDLLPDEQALKDRKNKNLGVMGVVPAITASMQVNEAIKLATKCAQPLTNKLLTFDLLTNNFNTFALK
jgi:Dinucleotide-utilizing enzymes involved in molybdopterin and thiamine biosynthesis family 2